MFIVGAMAVILFFVGQLLVPDGIVVQWVGNLNPQLQMFARLLTTWLEQHPQVKLGTLAEAARHGELMLAVKGEAAVPGSVIQNVKARVAVGNAPPSPTPSQKRQNPK